MALILAEVDADKWPCGCWQIVGHSTIHVCPWHQDSIDTPPYYWRTTATERVKLKVLEKERN